MRNEPNWCCQAKGAELERYLSGHQAGKFMLKRRNKICEAWQVANRGRI